MFDEHAQNSLKSLTMPQERESTDYLSLKTVLSENSLILSFTLSKRITRITETSLFLSPFLKANLEILLNLREPILSFHYLLCQCIPFITSNRLESTTCCQHAFCGRVTTARNSKEKTEMVSAAFTKQC